MANQKYFEKIEIEQIKNEMVSINMAISNFPLQSNDTDVLFVVLLRREFTFIFTYTLVQHFNGHLNMNSKILY